jgi:hypothetical protein
MGGAWIFVLFAVVAGGIAYGSYYLKKKRREGLAFAARQLGMEFALTDPFDTLEEPFELLRKGDGRGVEHVMWGTWQGIECRLFDYWYYEESTDSKGNRSRTYYRFSCVMSPVEASCSHLTLAKENLFTRLGDHLGFRDIEMESEEFNRAFTVKSPDRKFAVDFCDARMMEWLLAHGQGYGFEVVGDRLLASCRRLKPTELIPLLGSMRGFRDHIPRVVFSLYPKHG